MLVRWYYLSGNNLHLEKKIKIAKKYKETSFQGMSIVLRSAERVRRWISPLDQEFSRLSELCQGITLLLPPGFVPNGSPPPLRNNYVRVHTQRLTRCSMKPTRRDWYICYQQRGSEGSEGKEGKVRGGALNSPEVKALRVESWGEICHPTINFQMVMLLRQVARSV